MTAIKGQNLRLLVKDPNSNVAKCVALAQTCTVHLALELEEDTTKDDVSDWIDYIPVGISWDAQTQALVIIDAEDTDGEQLSDFMQVGMEVLVQFDTTNGTKNRNATQTILTGYAIISDIQINAQNQQVATYTVRLTGHGDLGFMPQDIADFVENNPRVAGLTYQGIGNVNYQGMFFACAVGKDSHNALYGWLITHEGLLTTIPDIAATVARCLDTDKGYTEYWANIKNYVSGIQLDHGGIAYGNFDYVSLTGTGIIGADYLGTINS